MGDNILLLDKLIAMLCKERGEKPPKLSDPDKFSYFRALVNVRPPMPACQEFLTAQNKLLQAELKKKGITDISSLSPIRKDIYLWRGDITTLKCDAIVNAANSGMLGCFYPNHGCIDNAIHTFAGVQLRYECAEIMKKQRNAEPEGNAKITNAYNLPCKYVIHTVGPVVYGEVTEKQEKVLSECYRSCLSLADDKGLRSLAFCCISTGEFRFPNRRAAEIAVGTVQNYKETTSSEIKVIFNVFKEVDYDIYAGLLGRDR